ncbi:MAG: transcription antitermination factor NusB [Chloroflexi bacterium HGW-Chloroflexi-8]|jgi:N utilization substance protein B|nr:MAG: transcription antitermination factor NusB [Chloroflexi bacterium HGW-Chloroflexi-8]
MKARTKARGIALQVLYEFDMTGHPPLLSLNFRLEEEPLDEKLVEFTTKIVTNILPLIPTLDLLIAEHAPEWPMDQLAVVDRNILRIALWEFAVEKCTPIKVAINEAIELAKMFGSDATPRFVNGVLGSLANRQNEIFQKLKNQNL